VDIVSSVPLYGYLSLENSLVLSYLAATRYKGTFLKTTNFFKTPKNTNDRLTFAPLIKINQLSIISREIVPPQFYPLKRISPLSKKKSVSQSERGSPEEIGKFPKAHLCTIENRACGLADGA
jgi:hypothetical protein